MRDRSAHPPRASAAARARLRADLGPRLAGIRASWAGATERSDAALRSGDRAAAARALDEQRALLRDLHAQVSSVLAVAAVEREAEAIVGAAADRPRLATTPARRGRPRPVGAAAGALLAVVGAVVAVVVAAVGIDQRVSTPEVVPLASRPDALVTAAGDQVQPAAVAFDRLADVLVELRSARTQPDTPSGVVADRRGVDGRSDGQPPDADVAGKLPTPEREPRAGRPAATDPGAAAGDQGGRRPTAGPDVAAPGGELPGAGVAEGLDAPIRQRIDPASLRLRWQVPADPALDHAGPRGVAP